MQAVGRVEDPEAYILPNAYNIPWADAKLVQRWGVSIMPGGIVFFFSEAMVMCYRIARMPTMKTPHGHDEGGIVAYARLPIETPASSAHSQLALTDRAYPFLITCMLGTTPADTPELRRKSRRVDPDKYSVLKIIATGMAHTVL